MDTFGKDFRLVDRGYVVEELLRLCEQRLTTDNADRKTHPISTFLGGPGVGKSILAQNLLSLLKEKAVGQGYHGELCSMLTSSVDVIATFGNGTPPVEDLDASTSLCLRWLHRECAVPTPFPTWVLSFSVKPTLKIQHTLSIIRQVASFFFFHTIHNSANL